MKRIDDRCGREWNNNKREKKVVNVRNAMIEIHTHNNAKALNCKINQLKISMLLVMAKVSEWARNGTILNFELKLETKSSCSRLSWYPHKYPFSFFSHRNEKNSNSACCLLAANFQIRVFTRKLKFSRCRYIYPFGHFDHP